MYTKSDWKYKKNNHQNSEIEISIFKGFACTETQRKIIFCEVSVELTMFVCFYPPERSLREKSLSGDLHLEGGDRRILLLTSNP